MGGDVSAVDLERLDPGAQYEVQVMALVQNREGTPVSVRVTTRESCLPMLYIYFKVPTSFNNPVWIGENRQWTSEFLMDGLTVLIFNKM